MKNKDYDLVYEKLFNPEIYENEANYTVNYAFAISNEKLTEVFDALNLKNKKILTVGSSGDQALNAILKGSKNVTIIDANIFTRAFIEYKLALIKYFDFKTFDDLFIKPRAFNWQVYAKISHLLSNETKQFWDSLMLDQSPNAQWGEFTEKDITSKMLIIDHSDRHSLFYKDEQTYNLLQNLLNQQDTKISFVNAELQDFPKVLKEKYDLIYLSNIYDYYRKQHNTFVKIINKLYTNNLKTNGNIFVNYDFDGHSKTTPTTFGKYPLITKKVKRWSHGEKCVDTLWIIKKDKISKKDNDVCK